MYPFQTTTKRKAHMELDTASGTWVTQGTWVSFNSPEPLIGYVFGITPCAMAAVLIPFDGWDEVQVIDPGQVRETLNLDQVKAAVEILTPADIDSITFDRAERQLRISNAREASHA
jgi:hypothetical protein